MSFFTAHVTVQVKLHYENPSVVDFIFPSDDELITICYIILLFLLISLFFGDKLLNLVNNGFNITSINSNIERVHVESENRGSCRQQVSTRR